MLFGRGSGSEPRDRRGRGEGLGAVALLPHLRPPNTALQELVKLPHGMASVLAGGPAQSSSADDHPSPLVSQAPSEQDLLLPSSSSPDASSNPSPWPPSDPTHHRHSRHAQHALQTLASLADQATSPPPDLRGSLGITHNLEAHGWLFHGVTSGVRIFSMEDEEMEGSVEREGSRPETTGGTEMKIKVRQGIRESESLPWFRGEGWVEGAWRVEDVAATLRSYGARAMCECCCRMRGMEGLTCV